MSIPLRLWLAVPLLMFAVWGHAQERKAESTAEKARRSESTRKRAVDDMVKREGISQVEAERRIEQVEKAFKPGVEHPLKKPNSDTGSFLGHNSSERSKQKAKITLKDLKPDRQPEDGMVRLRVAPSRRVAKTKASASRPQENDRRTDQRGSELGLSDNDKTSRNTTSGENADKVRDHDHDGDMGCDDPRKSQSEREVCKKREKSRD